MIKSFAAFALTVTLIVSLATPAPAQTGYRGKNELREARFAIDAADFRADQEGLTSLEIYYKIFYDGLSYQKTARGYEADYEIAISVEGDNDQQIEGIIRDGNIKVKTFSETRRPNDFVINMLSVRLDKQDVTIRAALTDKVGENVYQEERDVKERDYWGKYPTLSRIEFCREISPAGQDSKFNKGDLWVVPAVTRQFGGDFDTTLTFYQEVYPGRANVKYAKVITRVYHRVKGFVYTDTIDYGEIKENIHEPRTINVAGFMPGDYELEVRLEGRRGKVYDKIIEEFELMLTAETIYRSDFELAVDMLKYLATKKERKDLKNASTPEKRRELWDEFWRLRDEYGHNRENPTKEEYFRRVRHADRYFSVMKKDGWKTTRGMIYITYGEPDEVEDYPFELSTKPYQIWLYYRLSPPRKFVFIDEWGDGNYELQPPYNGIDW
jgi:GWxTD domain-containing protein